MSDVRRLAAATLVAALSLVGISSCQGGDEKPTSTPTQSEVSTPLESLSTEGLVVQRDAFCSGIGPGALEDALGSSDYRGSSYNNGDPARLTTGTKDVAHEFDCTWQTTDGTVARAWVFAPPVTRRQARQLAKASLRRGCAAADGAAFGAPSVATRCGTPEGRGGGLLRALRGRVAQLHAGRAEARARGPHRADQPLVRGGREGGLGPDAGELSDQLSADLSAPRRQRMPASRKPSSSPSKTDDGLPDSKPVRRSLTTWYGFST